jgi:AcrR family transcriptional regulator
VTPSPLGASATTPPRPRARRGEGPQLRELIVDATERLLIETGSEDAVSIRAIARAVGVTPPSIYLHFPDKEALILEVCERRFVDFDRVIESAGAGADDPVDALRRRARAYVRFGLERPEHYRILFMGKGTGSPDGSDAASSPGGVAFGHLVAAVQRAIDAAELRPDLDAFVTAVGLWTALHGVTSAMISLPTFPWPELDVLIDHVCESMLFGLAPRPGRPEE